MARIKKGLWYLCKKDNMLFKAGTYYYSPEDDMLNLDLGEYLVLPSEQKYFGKGEVIEIAKKVRKQTVRIKES